jgi:hypothetical protein
MKGAKTGKKVQYTDDAGEIAGGLTRIADFFPSPKELAEPAEGITLTEAVGPLKKRVNRRRSAT